MTAIRTLPSSLIKELPAEILRENLLQYDSGKRIEFLESVSDEEKNFYLDIYAPLGSKARDIYELDYERYLADPGRMTFVSENKEAILKNFLAHTRTYINRNPNYSSKIDAIVGEWARNLVAKYNKPN
jgi:hypothetical protein